MFHGTNCTFKFVNDADYTSWAECLIQIQKEAAATFLDISPSDFLDSVEKTLETGVGVVGKEVVSVSPEGKVENDIEAKSSMIELSSIAELDFFKFSKAAMEMFIVGATDILNVLPFGKAIVSVLTGVFALISAAKEGSAWYPSMMRPVLFIGLTLRMRWWLWRRMLRNCRNRKRNSTIFFSAHLKRPPRKRKWLLSV